MCSEPVTRTPASGFPAAYLFRIDIRPGISCSAMVISLRPQSASAMSATLYFKSVTSNVELAMRILLLELLKVDVLKVPALARTQSQCRCTEGYGLQPVHKLSKIEGGFSP